MYTKLNTKVITTATTPMVYDNNVVDAIKLKLLNYNNFSIAKLVVNKLDKVKLTLSCPQRIQNLFLIFDSYKNLS